MNDVPSLGYDEGDAVAVDTHNSAQQGPVSADVADLAHWPASDGATAIGRVDMVRVAVVALPARVVRVPTMVAGPVMPARLPAMVARAAVITMSVRMPVGSTATVASAAMVGSVASAIPIRVAVPVAVLLAALFIVPRAAIPVRVLGEGVSRTETADDRDRRACQDDLAKPFHQLFLQNVSVLFDGGHICKAHLYRA